MGIEDALTVLEQLSAAPERTCWPLRLRLDALETLWFGAAFSEESPEQRILSLQTCVFGILCKL